MLCVASPADFGVDEYASEKKQKASDKSTLLRSFSCLQIEAEAISTGIQHICCTWFLAIPKREREIVIKIVCNSANQIEGCGDYAY